MGTQTPLNMARLPRSKRRIRKNSIFNILSSLFLFIFVLAGIGIIFIFLYPQSPYNPFPPQSFSGISLSGTRSVTIKALQSNTLTANMINRLTLTPTQIAGSILSKPTLENNSEFQSTRAALTQEVGYSFAQYGDISAIGAGILNPERACKWMGVGGQVFDIQGRPSIGITVQLRGTLNDQFLSLDSLTGTSLQYGEAGFEFTLADHPVASENLLWIQLTDESHHPISKKIYFNTFNDCQKNVVIINFKQFQ